MSGQEILDYIKKSFELKNQGFHKLAIEMLYKALDIDSDNIEILNQLAHLYRLLDELDRATYYIEKVLDIDSNHVDSLILLYEIYTIQNKFDLAHNTIDKICEISSSDENLIRKLQVLRRLKKYDLVDKLIENFETQDDVLLLEIALTYFEKGDFEKSKEFLEKGYIINSNNIKIGEMLSKIYYKEKNTIKSKSLLEKLVEKTDNAENYNILGLIELDCGNNEKAISYFSKAKKTDESNAEYVYNLASAYFMNGWLEDAIRMFKKAICLQPMNIDYHYSLAYLYYQQEKYSLAVGEIEASLDINSQHQLSKVLQAMIMAKQGDLLNAKRNLDDIKNIVKDDDFVYYGSFTINKELGNVEKAREDLTRAIELKPDSLNYLCDKMDLECDSKNYEQAKEMALKILESNENFIQAHIALAKIYYIQNNADDMYAQAQDIIELDSNCPQGYYYNAIALFNQGDKNFAIESLKKAISLDLNNAQLYFKMSEFYQDLNDLETAYNWALEASEIDERNYNYRWLCAKIARTLNKNDDALRNYSHCYRFASNDKELCEDYVEFLNSIGRKEQAKRILANSID